MGSHGAIGCDAATSSGDGLAILLSGIAREGLPEDVQQKQNETQTRCGRGIAANLELLLDSEAIFHATSVSAAMVAQKGAPSSIA